MNNEDKLKAAFKNDVALREAIKLDEMEAPKMPADLNARRNLPSSTFESRSIAASSPIVVMLNIKSPQAKSR